MIVEVVGAQEVGVGSEVGLVVGVGMVEAMGAMGVRGGGGGDGVEHWQTSALRSSGAIRS